MRFHDLRHTCATLLFTRGVHPKIVSEMLGQSSVSITLDVYSHAIPGLGSLAVSAIEDALHNSLGVGSAGHMEIKDLWPGYASATTARTCGKATAVISTMRSQWFLSLRLLAGKRQPLCHREECL